MIYLFLIILFITLGAIFIALAFIPRDIDKGTVSTSKIGELRGQDSSRSH